MEGVHFWYGIEHLDMRGSFSKLFPSISPPTGNTLEIAEVFSTKSLKGVIRGMHLQMGIFANYRLVHVLSGAADDVLLDLRKGSPTYLHIEARKLTGNSPSCLLVPPGVAHGFQALEDSQMLYLTTSPYSPEHDTGVNPFSINHPWSLPVSNVSIRDTSLPTLYEWRDGINVQRE